MKLRKTLAVVFCMMLMMSCLLIPASAATNSNANIIVVADKTEVKAGETVTFSVVLVNAGATPEGVYSYDAKIAISGGLTLVEGSVKAVANEGFYSPIFNADLRCMSTGYNAEGNNGKGYNKGNLTLGTFQCKVESEGTATASAVVFTENGYSEVLGTVVNVDTYGAGGSATVTIAHEHTWTDWYVLVAPTCIAEGVEARDCSCGAQETRPLAKVAHTWGDWIEDVAPFCEIEGHYHRVCSVCGEVEELVKDALPHVPGEPFTETHKIYDESGNAFNCHDTVIKCTRCGVELSRVHNPEGQDPQPPMGDFTIALGMVAIIVMMIPCLLVSKFRAVK